MLVIFVYKFSTHEAIKIFGVVSVPNTLAPWACLLLFQLIPHVSFFGHLAGILVGFGMYGGGMRYLLPSAKSTDALVQRGSCSLLGRMPGYVKPPSSTTLTGLPVTMRDGVATTTAPGGGSGSGGRFPGVGRQMVPTAVRGASLYEEDHGAETSHSHDANQTQ
eukprot:m.9253 g.9253  ORF g.9253 m.9253 type:complete len:163 (+) comp2615_c0_seq1:2250-2738(+)